MADLIIIAALVVCALIGAHRGLLQSLAGVIIVVAAFFGASVAANAMAEPVAGWLQPVLEQHVQDKLAQVQNADVGTMLESFHFSGERLEMMVEQVMDKVSETGMALVSAVADSVTHSVAYAAVYVIAFLILLIALWLLMKPLQLMTKLPGLHMLNTLGGGALGLIWGALLTFLIVWAMLRFDWVLTQEMVADSHVLRFFAENSPVSLITSL